MAAFKLPNPLERRHLIQRELPPAQAARVAEAYRAEGRSLDALDFLHLAGDTEGLAMLRREAVQAGDTFLLRAIAGVTGQAPRRDEWQALAEAAVGAGKERYAADARRQAQREVD